MNAKSKCKRDSELMDFLREVLFLLVGCLTRIDRSFDLCSEKMLAEMLS